ncbi:hypothetical protein [Nostoc sp. KVJ20]|nr:hypothetical protein [Nostoc sp. KVJ20]
MANLWLQSHTNMRSRRVHGGNGIVSITLLINFACLGIAFDA